MKTLMTTLLLAILLLAAGCGGSGSPVIPDNHDSLQPFTEFARSGEFWYDPMPPGWVPDGTLMTHEDLAFYFSAHWMEYAFDWVSGGFPDPYQGGYIAWWLYHDLMLYSGYGYTTGLVNLFERAGFDIPDEIDIELPDEYHEFGG